MDTIEATRSVRSSSLNASRAPVDECQEAIHRLEMAIDAVRHSRVEEAVLHCQMTEVSAGRIADAGAGRGGHYRSEALSCLGQAIHELEARRLPAASFALAQARSSLFNLLDALL